MRTSRSATRRSPASRSSSVRQKRAPPSKCATWRKPCGRAARRCGASRRPRQRTSRRRLPRCARSWRSRRGPIVRARTFCGASSPPCSRTSRRGWAGTRRSLRSSTESLRDSRRGGRRTWSSCTTTLSGTRGRRPRRRRVKRRSASGRKGSRRSASASRLALEQRPRCRGCGGAFGSGTRPRAARKARRGRAARRTKRERRRSEERMWYVRREKM
mmetsp:Transcript_27225/g.81211  ORF Transcript_27225/g.81211 Transcript_27225/m.81211 type:complete len:215 (-) Transcript_27225:76-720(-)